MLALSEMDLFDLALEADCLAAKARNARCCDALRPCRSCRFLRAGVLARRIVVRVPRPVPLLVTRRTLLALPARGPAAPQLLAS